MLLHYTSTEQFLTDLNKNVSLNRISFIARIIHLFGPSGMAMPEDHGHTVRRPDSSHFQTFTRFYTIADDTHVAQSLHHNLWVTYDCM